MFLIQGRPTFCFKGVIITFDKHEGTVLPFAYKYKMLEIYCSTMNNIVIKLFTILLKSYDNRMLTVSYDQDQVKNVDRSVMIFNSSDKRCN